MHKKQFLNNNFYIHSYPPAQCVDEVLTGRCNIGLLPVFAAYKNPLLHRITNFGIACTGKVASVMLLSHTPLQNIKSIILDYQSNTSIHLTQILCKYFWEIQPEFSNALPGFESTKNSDAIVLIGDRVFQYQHQFKYRYDLGEEWFKFTALPFVFAAWYSIHNLDSILINTLNNWFLEGTQELMGYIQENKHLFTFDLESYLTHNIQYSISHKMEQGMQLYFDYCKKMNF